VVLVPLGVGDVLKEPQALAGVQLHMTPLFEESPSTFAAIDAVAAGANIPGGNWLKLTTTLGGVCELLPPQPAT
jgi:hypothetical protein